MKLKIYGITTILSGQNNHQEVAQRKVDLTVAMIAFGKPLVQVQLEVAYRGCTMNLIEIVIIQLKITHQLCMLTLLGCTLVKCKFHFEKKLI